MEILCVKRGIILQTRKSLITEVRDRTGVASPYTQTTRVEILCVKSGIILQTRKSLITEVRDRTGGAHHLHKPPGVEIFCIKRGIILQTRKSLDAHTGPIFQNLGNIKFHDIYLMQLGLFMYSYQNHTLP